MTENTTERVYIKLILTTKSPFSVCSGMDEFSDKDIIKRGDEPFIPGATLAGVFRYYIKTNGLDSSNRSIDEIDKDFFGYIHRGNSKDEHKAKQSGIIFGDAVLSENVYKDSSTDDSEPSKEKLKPKFIISFRDGVKLDDRKTAIDAGKYNYEIIEKGAKFEVIIEFHGKKADTKEFKEIIKQIAIAINSGELRIGSKVSRGLGYMGAEYYTKSFIKGECKAEDWLDFDPYDSEVWAGINPNQDSGSKEFYGIEADIEIPDTLMIRDYNVDPNIIIENDSEKNMTRDSNSNTSMIDENNSDKVKAKNYSNIEKLDYGQLCSANKNPVIPGTTWSGAFSHRAKVILEEILYSMDLKDIGVDVNNDKDKAKLLINKKVNRLLNIAFGQSENAQNLIETEDSKKICKSNLSFFESEIENYIIMPITRAKIDRFTGGSMHGALFTENVCCGGKTKLKIGINRKCDEKKAIMGLIFLCLDELDEGLLAIGGETAVGRGIMKVKIKNNNDFIREECIKSLAEELRK